MGKFCPNCGNEVSEDATFCGSCGNQIGNQNAQVVNNVNAVNQVATDKTNGFAIAGFVLSFLIPILGVIFSSIGMSKTKKLNQKGYGLAVAGLIISIVNWVFGIILQYSL